VSASKRDRPVIDRAFSFSRPRHSAAAASPQLVCLVESADALPGGAFGASQADGGGITSAAPAGFAPGGRLAGPLCFTGGMLLRYAAMA
jgi:hypothetical protein